MTGVTSSGSPGPFERNNPSGFIRNYRDIAAASVERADDIELDSAVYRRDAAERFAICGREPYFLGGHPRDRIVRDVIFCKAAKSVCDVRVGIRQKSAAAAGVADGAGELSRIDALKSRNSETYKVIRKISLAAEVGRIGVVLADNQAADRRRQRLGVLGVDAVIADKRVCHNHRLIGV